MDSASRAVNWHYESLPKRTKRALDFLSNQEWLKKSSWYLAGGTALALQSGNRKSVDLDFFCSQKDFDGKKLLARFIDNKDWIIDVEDTNTIYGRLFDAKISFIAYPFFVPKQPMLNHGSVHILEKTDIAVMKITAISQRGRKRDFFDLYWCSQNVEPLLNSIKRLKKQYPDIAHNYHHIIKALTYFDDAESDPNPEIYFKASWKEVKAFFRKVIPVIADKLIR